ncbi:hypothetical protein ABT112_16980 [Streptomyces sp. NPDC002055]|uniref:hypothetical protein n=1 Tax=Streptomyces sp. NPDC002055 TaxID=3154534 RepID=UPI00331C96C9
MTALRLADAGEAADLAAFLARLIHYDRRAAVRLQAEPGAAAPESGGVLAVFGRPASFEVLAIRTARLAASPVPHGATGAPETVAALDATVSAGMLADALDTATGGGERTTGELTVPVPEPVTGPPWAGVLPPRGGWRRVEGFPGADEVRAAVAAAVREFRTRIEALPEDGRTRTEFDRIGGEIWSRTLGDTRLPLRAVHAAQSLGFLRPAQARVPATGVRPSGAAATGASASGAATIGASTIGASTTGVPANGVSAADGPGTARHGHGTATALAPEPAVPERLALFAAGSWLRLSTPYGSVAVRRTDLPGLSGLSVTPR